MSQPWSDADEAAYVAATKQPDVAPEPARDRYSAIRRYLTVAKERNGELPAETYLLGQVALILMDIGAEIVGLRDDIATMNALLIAQRTPNV